jgi:hypothetical protein
MNEYDKLANDFLEAQGIGFKAFKIGIDCPMLCEDKGKHPEDVGKFPRKTHIHGDHYQVTLTREGNPGMVLDFWNSYNDEEFNYCLENPYKSDGFEKMYKSHSFKNHYGVLGYRNFGASPKRPTAYDVLSCIQKYDPGSFHDFCSEFGYNEDSISDKRVWRACVDEWRKVRAFFTPEEIEILGDIN